ncbi:hypothetical protein VNO77_00276 [Canavalia gladiata]|uniref:Uncharacterized protein n=1 Tax=Canavalia gladiata TaxID=3824 RepID=A0AAN9MPA8_CANGL
MSFSHLFSVHHGLGDSILVHDVPNNAEISYLWKNNFSHKTSQLNKCFKLLFATAIEAATSRILGSSQPQLQPHQQCLFTILCRTKDREIITIVTAIVI